MFRRRGNRFAVLSESDVENDEPMVRPMDLIAQEIVHLPPTPPPAQASERGQVLRDEVRDIPSLEVLKFP